jgi:hypothetical protein
MSIRTKIAERLVFSARKAGGMAVALLLPLASIAAPAQERPMTGHPRLYFTPSELKGLREARKKGFHARMWRPIAEAADWCLTYRVRAEWIAPTSTDPIFLNLYDRLVMKHLAFAYACSGESRYYEGWQEWALACAAIWKREADGEPGQNRAYAALRLLKRLQVAYDLPYDRLSEEDWLQIRAAMVEIGREYYQWYRKSLTMAEGGQDKHYGSVEAASIRVAALALLGEEPEAQQWLDLMVRKHTEYLLPSALTASGTQEQSSKLPGNYHAVPTLPHRRPAAHNRTGPLPEVQAVHGWTYCAGGGGGQKTSRSR